MTRISLIIFTMLSVVFSQQFNIERINFDSKQNGITINISSDFRIQSSEITGWYNPSTSWSYITIYNAVGNIDNLNKSYLVDGITDLEIIQLNESLQLGIRTINSIESFEFYQGSDYMMTASLRYPIDQTLALIDKKVVEGKTRLGDIKSSLSEFKTIFYLISVIALIDILVN